MSFTLSPTSVEVTFDTGGGSTVVAVDVGEVSSPETVTLSLDTSSLPSWVTASLDVSSLTTPGTAHVTVMVASDVPTGSWDLFVNASDSGGENQSCDVTVTTHVSGPVSAWDQTQPQETVGTWPTQHSGPFPDPYLAAHNGELYLAWAELDSPNNHGPYVAVWTGTAWSVVGTGFETDSVALRASPLLASDGTNLYLAYLIEQAQTVGNPCASGTIQVVGYSARVWKYDGTSWTDLGTLISGSGGHLPVTSMMGENGPGGGGRAILGLSASPDEVGACYIALYEDGWVAASALGGHGGASCEAQRHLYVQGFGGSTLGFVDLTSILLQPSVLSPHFDAPEFDYAFQLRGSGANLVLYAMQGDAYEGIPITGGVAHATIWKVWQPGGWLPDLDLATAFGNSYFTLTNFQSAYIVASDDKAGERIIFAEADYTDGDVSGTFTTFARTSDVAAPETLGDVDGHWQLNGPIGTHVHFVKQDTADVWGFATGVSGGVGATALVAQLADRCGVISWQLVTPDDYVGSNFAETAFELFGDALYAIDLSTPAVIRLPIARGAGVCAVGARIWQRI